MENPNGMERRTAAAEELKSKGVGSGDLVLPLSPESKLWHAMQMKADLFDYLCWLEVVTPPEELHGADFLCMASDGTTCWAKTYAEAVRVAMEHDKEI